MKNLAEAYPDLRFSKGQLYFSDEEYRLIADDFWNRNPKGSLTDRDRAFIQAALFVAIDKSEQAGLIFAIYRSFVSAAPKKSLKALLQKLATNGAKQAYSKYIDSTPKYSAVGRAAIQYSAFASQWRARVHIGDTSFLDNFLKASNL